MIMACVLDEKGKRTYRDNKPILYDVEPVAFHRWGCDFEEFCDGPPGNFSVAIVEHGDGRVSLIEPELLRFTDK